MKKISTLLIAVCLFAATNLKAQVNIQDSLALVNLYDSTDGANWYSKTNWLTKAPVSTWYGIGLDANNRVDSIKLVTGLKGSIPYSLGNLNKLTYLLLGNKLTGRIPSSLGNLTNLAYLDLSHNTLTDTISSSLGNFTSLQFLGLSGNQLTGSIPSSFGNLTNLTKLYLNNNKLSNAIPASLGNLTNLQELVLCYNQLSGTIPSSLGNLTNLVELRLYNNQLTGTIPTSLGNLTNLTFFVLQNNQLSGTIPSSILNLTKLSPTGQGGVSNNKFTFAGMEPIAKLKAYNNLYAPQAIVPLQQNNADTTLSVSVGGTPINNTYKWYNSGTLVATKTIDSSYRPTSNGLYYTAATNAVAIYLTLHSDTITINYPTNIQDSLALVDLYNSTGGATWVNHTNWLTKLPVSSWFGVTEYNWRVTGISLAANNLKGAIPSSLVNLPYLISLALNNNKLIFSGVEAIAKKYSFAVYVPQANVSLLQNGNTLSVSIGGTTTNNTYKWYKNGTLVATNKSDSTYTVTANGKYWVVASNAVATKLTLYSDTINITTLPIKDITLSAKQTNGQVQLQWQTMGEVNTGFFTIQRSLDGVNFTDVNTKTAVGSGNNSYSYVDAEPPFRGAGGLYYRIKAIDKDGASTYSQVVSVQLTIDNYQLSIIPNPSRDVVTVMGNKITSVQVIDNMGRVVKGVSLNHATNPTLSIRVLPAGVYHLRIQTADGKVSGVRFVKE